MTQIGTNFIRTSTMMSSTNLLSALRRTQLELLDVQTQISTGLKVNRPSDAPQTVSAILELQDQMRRREQDERNLALAIPVLGEADSSLGELASILREAMAQAQEHADDLNSGDQARADAADGIQDYLTSLLNIANRRTQGIAVFGGDRGGEGVMFVEVEGGGIRYLGSVTNLTMDIGTDRLLEMNSNGADAFGTLSARVVGQVDLDPPATAGTHLDDLNGALNQGVRSGSVVVTVNGSSVTVDLADAETLGDVVTRVNDAITNLGGDPASQLAVAGGGLQLTIGGPDTIAIAESGTGHTAEDLGLLIPATGAGVVGPTDLDPKLTMLTDVTGFGLDLASGMQITQGITTKTADFSSVTTIQDMANVINALDMGLRLEINSDQTGLNLVTDVSGVELSIGENGGTTATDLGLRSYDLTTSLADFNHGDGVHSVEGRADFQLQLHDGTTFDVDATGLTTVDELVTAIDTAAAAAGVVVGVDFSVALATTGNGLVFTDNTVGAADFQLVALQPADSEPSYAARDLGIEFNAGAGNSATSTDVATVHVESVFTHLMDLRDALSNNDRFGISLAPSRLNDDYTRALDARADVGMRQRWVLDTQERSQDMGLAEEIMRLELREGTESDFTEIVTRYSQLMSQLQASLQVGGMNLQMSLLDFLR